MSAFGGKADIGRTQENVEVKLNVVTPNNLEQTTTKLLTNPEKPNDINAVDLSATQVDGDEK
jgi:hypothetical protein